MVLMVVVHVPPAIDIGDFENIADIVLPVVPGQVIIDIWACHPLPLTYVRLLALLLLWWC